MAVNRLKHGERTRQPLGGSDCGVLYRERQSDKWVCMSERGPFTREGFAKLGRAVADRAGIANVYPHALRHASGHACGHCQARRKCTMAAYDGAKRRPKPAANKAKTKSVAEIFTPTAVVGCRCT
jgi:integrase